MVKLTILSYVFKNCGGIHIPHRNAIARTWYIIGNPESFTCTNKIYIYIIVSIKPIDKIY